MSNNNKGVLIAGGVVLVFIVVGLLLDVTLTGRVVENVNLLEDDLNIGDGARGVGRPGWVLIDGVDFDIPEGVSCNKIIVRARAVSRVNERYFTGDKSNQIKHTEMELDGEVHKLRPRDGWTNNEFDVNLGPGSHRAEFTPALIQIFVDDSRDYDDFVVGEVKLAECNE